MEKLLGTVVCTLVLGIAIGVAFSYAYPTVAIDGALGLFFALAGLLLCALLRAARNLLMRRGQ